MARDLRTFTFDKVASFVDGIEVDSYWEGDDVIMIEPNAPLSNNIVGAGGDVLASISTDRAAKITLRLQHTSDMHAYLTGILRQYQDDNPRVFSFGANDVGTGEGGSAPKCVLLDNPVKSFGQQASAREWTFFAACWTDNFVQYNGL